MINSINKVDKILKERKASNKIPEILFLIAQRLYIQSTQETVLTLEKSELFDQVFNQIFEIWDEAEKVKKEKEKKDEETFQFKAKSHTLKTDEEINEEEFQKLFPSFTSEFAEFIQETLNNKKEIKNQEQIGGKGKEDTSSQTIVFENPKLVEFIKRIHYLLFTQLNNKSCINFNPSHQKNLSVDQECLFTSSYDLASIMIESIDHQVPQSFDFMTREAHIFRSQKLEKLIKMNEGLKFTGKKEKEKEKQLDGDDLISTGFLNSKESYNFYKDSNIAEVRRSHPPLQNLLLRSQELLKLWPEHEILQQMVIIITRVLGFPLSSPLMKILTGIELILQKAQDWESYASKQYSIKSQLKDISKLIVRWRQIEVKSWPMLLSSKVEEKEEGVSKFWFHLHNIVHGTPEFIKEDSSNEVERQEYFKNFVNVIDNFLQSSSVGEFCPRVKLVNGFSNQILIKIDSLNAMELKNQIQPNHKELTKFWKSTSSYLTNMVSYYSQFIPIVQEDIEKSKKPIEKELADFCKIAKWKDINYFALKESAEKTHRTIHKFVKKFDEILVRPVMEIFTRMEQSLSSTEKPTRSEEDGDVEMTEKEKEEEIEQLTQKKKKQSRKKKKKQVKNEKMTEPEAQEVRPEFILDQVIQNLSWSQSPLTLETDDYSEDILKKVKEIQGNQNEQKDSKKNISFKVSKLYLKMKNYCEEIFLMNGKSVLLGFEEISETILQRIEEFRKIDATTKYSEETKKTFQILKTQKRLALNDLLKFLKFVGFSNHRASFPSNQKEAEHIFEKVVPFVHTILQPQEKGIPQELSQFSLDLWNKSNEYYYKNLSKISTFRKSSLSPSKELRPQDVEKASNFVEHTLFVLIQQRSLLSDITTKQLNLQYLVQFFSGFHDLSKKIVLKHEGSHVDPSKKAIFENQLRADYLILQKQIFDELISQLSQIQSYLELLNLGNDARAIQLVLENLIAQKISTDELLSKFWYQKPSSLSSSPLYPTSLAHLTSNNHTVLHTSKAELSRLLSNIYPQFWMTISSIFTYFETRHESFQKEFTNIQRHHQTHDFDEFMATYNFTVKSILTCIQDLKQIKEETNQGKQKSKMENQTDGETQVEDEEVQEFSEYGMTEKQVLVVHKKFISIFNSFDMETMTQNLSKLLTIASSQDAKNDLISFLFYNIYPLIQQLQLTFQRFLFEYLLFHKSLCKFHYILINVFDTLVRKGFCLPNKMSDQQEGDSIDDVEGTGMAEGEGKKDVSDQIENEEQVIFLIFF